MRIYGFLVKTEESMEKIPGSNNFSKVSNFGKV